MCQKIPCREKEDSKVVTMKGGGRWREKSQKRAEKRQRSNKINV